MPDLAPHEQRVVTERADLVEKTTKLLTFIDTDVFLGLAEEDKRLLREQASIMNQYVSVLDRRIARFQPAA